MNRAISIGQGRVCIPGVVVNRQAPLIGMIDQTSMAWRFNGSSLFIDHVVSIDQLQTPGATRYRRGESRAERWKRSSAKVLDLKVKLEAALAELREVQEEYSRHRASSALTRKAVAEIVAVYLEPDLSGLDDLKSLRPPREEI